MTLLRTLLGKPVTFYEQTQPGQRCWRTRSITSKTISCAGDAISTRHYEGGIWCPSTETGFWVAERNGLVFITGNTLSAAQTAGAGSTPILKELLREYPGKTYTGQQLNRYWPAMALLVMTGIPAAIQAAIFAAFGDPDQGDQPIPALNEIGKQGLGGIGGHIDVTPLTRAMGLYGGTSGKRRVYTRWAKQSTEVFDGWLMSPTDTFAGKTSQVVKLAWEQLFGTTTAGWDMDFKGEGASGILLGKSKGLLGGRIASVAEKVVPISVLSLAEGRPVNFMAPMSQGMSLKKAQDTFAGVLATYADQARWDDVKRNGKAKANLKELAPTILDAAKRNGFNPDEVVQGARRVVLTGLYREFFMRLNRNDFKGMHEIALRLVRANATAEDALRSVKFRSKTTEREMTPERSEAVAEAFK